MVQTAPNTLRNSIQAGFWGPFTASQRVFRVLESFLFLRSSDPATLLACFLDRSELQAEWFGCAQDETLAPKRGEKDVILKGRMHYVEPAWCFDKWSVYIFIF